MSYLCGTQSNLMKNLLAVLFICTAFMAYGQYDPNYKKQYQAPNSPFNFGVGLGLDYGAIGVKFSGYPAKHFGLFAGVGYNFVKVGYNLGGIGRILPDKKVCPYVTGMYGSNSVIIVQNASHYNKVYYGPTLGGGIELHFGTGENFMNFGLLIPIRSQQFYDDWDRIKLLPGMTDATDPLPVGISVGYHFRLQ
jgi:hypothetical protein